MDWSRSNNNAQCNNQECRGSVSNESGLSRARFIKYNKHNSNHSGRKRNRNYLYILSIIFVLNPLKVLANTSQTAAPVANSSGSVTNMAIQSLQGNMIQNQYGNGIVCQGPMLTASPFLTDSFQQQFPKEHWYDSPVYSDTGDLLYHQRVRTGQKDSASLNWGFSITFSMPLDNSLQKRCKRAADAQIGIQEQILKDKELSWHVARLKECGALKKSGIEFAKNSVFYSLCEDVLVLPKMGQVLPHRHNIPPISSSSKEVNLVSPDKK